MPRTEIVLMHVPSIAHPKLANAYHKPTDEHKPLIRDHDLPSNSVSLANRNNGLTSDNIIDQRNMPFMKACKEQNIVSMKMMSTSLHLPEVPVVAAASVLE